MNKMKANRTDLQFIQDLYRYNRFAWKRYLGIIEEFPWAEVLKDRGASFH
jgi:hypothetical protein